MDLRAAADIVGMSPRLRIVECGAVTDNRYVGASMEAVAGFAIKCHQILSRFKRGSFGFYFHLQFSLRPINFGVSWRFQFQITATFKFDGEENRFGTDGHARAA